MTSGQRTILTELVPLLLVGAAGILGSVVGEAAFFVMRGRAAPVFGISWLAPGFGVAAIGLAFWWKSAGTLIRTALVLAAAGQLTALLPAPTLAVWMVRLALHGAMAILIGIACWRIATRKVRAAAVAAFLAVALFRYRSIHNWYMVTGRSQLFTSQWIQEPSTSHDISA